jgi:hypothetical protein
MKRGGEGRREASEGHHTITAIVCVLLKTNVQAIIDDYLFNA